MDYLFVGRSRRVSTVSNAFRRPQQARTCVAAAQYQALRWQHAAQRLCFGLCFQPPPASKESVVDIGGHALVLYEAIADDKSTERGIATRLWRCSLGMAAWLAEQGYIFDGATVLEVGTGIGLCALTLAAASTAAVTATDLDEEAVELVRAAARRQGLSSLSVRTLDLCDSSSPLPPADWMVVCDVMYVPELAEATARRVAEQARRGGHVLVGDPGRPARRAFLDELARELGRRVSFVPAHEAPRLAETAGAGGVPELRLLLFDEHCRPPFYGIR